MKERNNKNYQPSILSIKVNQNNFNKWEENNGKSKFNSKWSIC